MIITLVLILTPTCRADNLNIPSLFYALTCVLLVGECISLQITFHTSTKMPQINIYFVKKDEVILIINESPRPYAFCFLNYKEFNFEFNISKYEDFFFQTLISFPQ